MEPGRHSSRTARSGLIALISAGALGIAIPLGIGIPSVVNATAPDSDPPASPPSPSVSRRHDTATSFAQPSPAECERQRAMAFHDPRVAGSSGPTAELCNAPSLPPPESIDRADRQRQNTRQRGPLRAAPVPHARGGGPSAPHVLCLGPDGTSEGRCAAPDLAPTSPQQQWNRDPRAPSPLQQNDPGPAEPGASRKP